jgi:hypothetical protein
MFRRRSNAESPWDHRVGLSSDKGDTPGTATLNRRLRHSVCSRQGNCSWLHRPPVHMAAAPSAWPSTAAHRTQVSRCGNENGIPNVAQTSFGATQRPRFVASHVPRHMESLSRCRSHGFAHRGCHSHSAAKCINTGQLRPVHLPRPARATRFPPPRTPQLTSSRSSQCACI